MYKLNNSTPYPLLLRREGGEKSLSSQERDLGRVTLIVKK